MQFDPLFSEQRKLLFSRVEAIKANLLANHSFSCRGFSGNSNKGNSKAQ